MADAGENQRPTMINLSTTARTVAQAPRRERDFHRTETNIVNSSIDTVQAGYSQDRQETAQVISGSTQCLPDESDNKATLMENPGTNTATNSPTSDVRPVSSNRGPIKETLFSPTSSAEAETTPKVPYSPEDLFCPNPDQTKSTEEPNRLFAEGFAEEEATVTDVRTCLAKQRLSEDTKKPLSLLRNVLRESQTSSTLTGEESEFNEVGTIVAEKKMMLNDRARYLLAKSPPDYDGVVKLLGSSIVTSSGDIVGKTLVAESLLQLQKTKKAHKVIKRLKEAVKKLEISGNDILEYANNLAANSAHSRAIILYPIASSIFRSNALSSDELMDKIHECNVKMFDSVHKLTKSGDNSGKVGLESMEKMCDNISSLSNVNPDKITLEKAWVLDKIGFIYNLEKNYEAGLNVRLEAIDLLNDHFHGKQSMYQVHGRLLHNIGNAHKYFERLDQANKYYFDAANAYRHATDFSSKNEKDEKIKESEEARVTKGAKKRKKKII